MSSSIKAGAIVAALALVPVFAPSIAPAQSAPLTLDSPGPSPIPSPIPTASSGLTPMPTDTGMQIRP